MFQIDMAGIHHSQPMAESRQMVAWRENRGAGAANGQGVDKVDPLIYGVTM